MTMTALPPPPSPADTTADFNSKAFNLLGALPTFVTEANALETNVVAKEAAATASAAASATSETNADASEAAALAHKNAAATSEANALAHKNAAATSETNAAASAAAAAASYDAFDDRFLGAKAADPTVDNDGNALIVGALYYNTTVGQMRVWDSSLVWAAAGATLADGSVTTQKLADDAVTFAKVQNIATARILGRSSAGAGNAEELTPEQALVTILNGGQLAGMRNKIINGKMEIGQRGTSFAAMASGTYCLDRWYMFNAGTGILTLAQVVDTDASNEFTYSLRATVTTADAAVAASDLTNIQQRIEGYNARDLIGRTFTLSFWVRSAKTGAHCVALVNGGVNRSYVAEYTVNAANTWEKKTITVTGGLITAGTWDWVNGVGLIVEWALACGSTYQTTANAWQTGNFGGTANQVNVLDTVGNIFAITGVQLEVGSQATPFEHRPVGLELSMCKRYYEFVGGTSLTSRPQYTHYAFNTTKRAAPTLALLSGTLSGANFDGGGDPTASFRCPAATAATGGAADWVISATAEL